EQVPNQDSSLQLFTFNQPVYRVDDPPQIRRLRRRHSIRAGIGYDIDRMVLLELLVNLGPVSPRQAQPPQEDQPPAARCTTPTPLEGGAGAPPARSSPEPLFPPGGAPPPPPPEGRPPAGPGALPPAPPVLSSPPPAPSPGAVSSCQSSRASRPRQTAARAA